VPAAPRAANAGSKKKVKSKGVRDMRPQYQLADFDISGERGRYLARYREASNLVHLAPDVAAIVPTDEAVNEALRSLIRIAGRSAVTPAPRSGRAGPKPRRSARDPKRN
jgi:hypothetical protein